MKANEVPKSKFVYPDKLYARTNNNITIDISYAPQTLEAVEYTRTDAFIEKAVQYLKDHKEEVETEDNGIVGWISDCFIKDFVKYMKGG